MYLFRQFFGLFAILAVVVAIIPILIPDEDYSTGAQQWFEIARAPISLPPQQNRFHAEVGFQAATDSNFIQQGAELVEGINQALRNQQTEFDMNWQQPAISASQGASQIGFDIVLQSPINWLQDNQALLQTLVEDNSILLERYRVMNAMPDYAYSLTPNFFAPLPSYVNLTHIHRVNSLRIAASILNNDEGLDELRQQIEARRRALAQAATLIEKLINVALLRFDLRLYAALMSQPGLANRHQPFAALNSNEHTMTRAYIHEFVSGSALLEHSIENESLSDFEHWIMRLYFKQRRLENHSLEHTWLGLIALEQQPLAARHDLQAESTYSWWDMFTDPLGYIFYEVSRPSFTYHDRIEHLDGLITLVNSAAEIHRRDLGTADIPDFIEGIRADSHPGYSGASLIYDSQRDVLTFEIPGFSSDIDNEPPELTLKRAGSL